MGYIDLIPDVFRLTMPDLATGKSYHTQKFNVGNKQCIGVTIKASQALSVSVAYGIATDTAAAAGVDIAASLPYKTSATSFASNTSTEGGTYHEIAVPPHARQAQLVISNASGSTVSGAVIDAALRVVAYPAASGSGSSDFASITGWPGSSSQFVHADGSYSPLSAGDIPNLPASKIVSGTIDDARLPSASNATAVVSALTMIGASGQKDGNATISGSVTLTGPKQYDILTLATGCNLIVNGYEVCARKIIQQGTGKITANGAAGTSASGATAGTGGAALAVTFGTLQTAQTTSRNGATGTTGAGAAGQGAIDGTNTMGGIGGPAGFAITSSGGAGTSGSGGSSGVSTQNFNGSVVPWTFGPMLKNGALIQGGTTGAGGGSGAGDGTNAGGGGGGAGNGGNVVEVWAGEIDVSSATGPLVTAHGGAGGAGGNGSGGNTGGGGGGCGGGAGVIRVVAGKITGTLSGALVATGGAGGAGGNGVGTGSGGKGGQGGGGGAIYFFRGDTGAWAFSVLAGSGAGSAPSAASGTTGSAGTAGVSASISF